MDVHGNGQVVAQVFCTTPEHAVRVQRDQDFPGIIQAELVWQGKQVLVSPSGLMDGQQPLAEFIILFSVHLFLS